MTYANEIHALLDGLLRSILVSMIGIAMALIVGASLGAVRHARKPLLDPFIGGYVNVFRCTPLLVQVMMLYFALPNIGLELSPFETAWLSLGLWGGAYYVEIFRASFDAVPHETSIGARALGISQWKTFLLIVLPVGLRSSIPAATTMAITQFRSSSFMIVVGYAELTYVANELVANTFQVFHIFGIAAMAYLIVSSGIAFASRALERKVTLIHQGVAR